MQHSTLQPHVGIHCYLYSAAGRLPRLVCASPAKKPSLGLALALSALRLPHTRHGSRSPVITVAAAQRARGARDGGAEQRPLARCRCSVCQPETRALPLHARLLPCPVTRRALARPPHRARSARMLAAAAARPRAATLAPTLPHARSVEGQSACLWHRRSSDRASGRCSAPPSRARRCSAPPPSPRPPSPQSPRVSTNTLPAATQGPCAVSRVV